MSTLRTVGPNYRADQKAKREVIVSISKVTAHSITRHHLLSFPYYVVTRYYYTLID